VVRCVSSRDKNKKPMKENPVIPITLFPTDEGFCQHRCVAVPTAVEWAEKFPVAGKLTLGVQV